MRGPGLEVRGPPQGIPPDINTAASIVPGHPVTPIPIQSGLLDPFDSRVGLEQGPGDASLVPQGWPREVGVSEGESGVQHQSIRKHWNAPHQLMQTASWAPLNCV